MLLKKILLIACLFVAVKASAQDIIVKGDTMILPNGAKFSKGEEITLGRGSAPDKSFSFIYQPEISYLTKKRLLSADFYGKKIKIKKFQRDGAYKKGYSYNILVLDIGGLRNYWCDIEHALENHEVVYGHYDKAPSTKPKKNSNGPVVF